MINYETKIIKIDKLKENLGQIKDVPKNPRFIKDDYFEKLKKSILDYPEMLKLREIVCYDTGTELIVIGGNMRFRACKELEFTEIPCKILDKNTSPEKIREFIIKDNRDFGKDDFDALANEWEIDELLEWGFEEFELGKIDFIENDVGKATPTEKLPQNSVVVRIGNFLFFIHQETKKDDDLWDFFYNILPKKTDKFQKEIEEKIKEFLYELSSSDK